MKTMTVEEFKSHFAEVLKQVKAGIGFYFLPESQLVKPKRKLGILEGKAKVTFKDDFKMSEEDLIG